MNEIAQAIANRQSEIDRLQAEIKALTDVEQILGTSAPKARSTSRRSSSPPTKAAAAADSKSEAKPARKRREMLAAEKKAVSMAWFGDLETDFMEKTRKPATVAEFPVTRPTLARSTISPTAGARRRTGGAGLRQARLSLSPRRSSPATGGPPAASRRPAGAAWRQPWATRRRGGPGTGPPEPGHGVGVDPAEELPG